MLGASGIWLASPHAPASPRRSTVGAVVAMLGLLLLVWQLPWGGHGISGGLLCIVSAASLAAATGSVVAEQARVAAACFGLMLAAFIVLFLFIGAWPLALVVATLSGSAVVVGKFVLVGCAQSWCGMQRETDSWEPMLASATAAVVVGALATMISRRIGVGESLVHGMAIIGLPVFAIGLVGLISRISTARMFIAAGVMLCGAVAAALGWSGPFDVTLDGPFGNEVLLGTLVVGLVGGLWIVSAIVLVRLEDGADRSAAGRLSPDRPDGLMNTRLYVLLTAVGVVVLIGVLRMGG